MGGIPTKKSSRAILSITAFILIGLAFDYFGRPVAANSIADRPHHWAIRDKLDNKKSKRRVGAC